MTSPTPTRELLPCPFPGCNGPGVLDVKRETIEGMPPDEFSMDAYVWCHECGARGPRHDGWAFDEETAAEIADKAVTAWNTRPAPAEREGVVVPREPSIGLLMSMALRLDHAIGCKGYYDQFGMDHARRLEVAIADMRKVYEEISGQGFYKPEREAEYAAMALAGREGG